MLCYSAAGSIAASSLHSAALSDEPLGQSWPVGFAGLVAAGLGRLAGAVAVGQAAQVAVQVAELAATAVAEGWA